MEHVVFFPAPDGSPGFRRVTSLDEAVRLVEHLRNVEGVDAVSVHALTEVSLQFRAYYRVEVPALLDVPVGVDVPLQARQPVRERVDLAPIEAVYELAPEPVPADAAATGTGGVVPSLTLVEAAPPTVDDAHIVPSAAPQVTSLGFFS